MPKSSDSPFTLIDVDILSVNIETRQRLAKCPLELNIQAKIEIDRDASEIRYLLSLSTENKVVKFEISAAARYVYEDSSTELPSSELIAFGNEAVIADIWPTMRHTVDSALLLVGLPPMRIPIPKDVELFSYIEDEQS